jgi:hypothetical protein
MSNNRHRNKLTDPAIAARLCQVYDTSGITLTALMERFNASHMRTQKVLLGQAHDGIASERYIQETAKRLSK